MQKAYIIGNRELPPVRVGKPDWYKFRISIALFGKDKFDMPLSEKEISKIWPFFTLVALDKESAKKRLCEVIDDVFDGFEQ